MTKLDLLVSLQGKTLKWSGFDKESDGYVLLFDDGTALNVTEFEPIDDFPVFAHAMVMHEIAEAKQIVALERILNPPQEEVAGAPELAHMPVYDDGPEESEDAEPAGN